MAEEVTPIVVMSVVCRESGESAGYGFEKKELKSWHQLAISVRLTV